MVTQQMYDATLQNIRNLHVKINLLNFSFQVVDSLEGNALSGSITIDAQADIRRSCKVELAITDSTFNVQPGGKIFLDRYIQIYVGIEDIYTNEIIWYNQGIYIINAPSYTYQADTNTLSFEGLDLMAKLTGARNGYLIGTTYKVPKGSQVHQVMMALLQEAGMTKFSLVTNEQTVPYDMSFDQGSTYYDILAALRDILPNYQIYFDVDGVFNYNLIPSGSQDNIIIDDDTWNKMVITEDINVDFQSVKNSIEIFGKTHEVEHYSSTTTVSANVVNLTIPSLTSLDEYIIIGFTPLTTVAGDIYLSVNSFGNKKLVGNKGNFINALEANIYYVASYQADGTWLFLGHLQAYASIKDTNPLSPFYVNGTVGEIRIALFGEDYDNIQSDELAYERAEFELYTRCRLNDTVTLDCVPIYYADVYQLTRYTTQNTQETNLYMIQRVTFELSENATQTIEMSRYYPYYPVLQ